MNTARERESLFGTRHPSPGIFNYSLRGEPREREENNAAGAPGMAAFEGTLLCVYLVLLIASARSESAITAERRSRISVCSPHGCTSASVYTRLSAFVDGRNQSSE